MSDTVKLVIEIPKKEYEAFKELIAINIGGRCSGKGIIQTCLNAVKNGIPLDDVRAEIKKKCDRIDSIASVLSYPRHREIQELLCEILESIGKADMRESIGEKIRCNTCKNNDDELSGECYECLKGIFDHYEAQESEVKPNDDNNPQS